MKIKNEKFSTTFIIKQKNTNILLNNQRNVQNCLFCVLFSFSLISLFILITIHSFILKQVQNIIQNESELFSLTKDITNKISYSELFVFSSDTTLLGLTNEIYNQGETANKLNQTLLDIKRNNSLLQMQIQCKSIINSSKILTTQAQINKLIHLIQKGFGFDNNTIIGMNNIYDAEIDGTTNRRLLNKVGGKKQLLFVIECEDENIGILGGYINIKITTESSSFNLRDNKAFMYSLKLNEIYPIISNLPVYWHHPQVFFTFGNLDLIIYNDFLHKMDTAVKFPDSFTVDDELDKLIPEEDKKNRFTKGKEKIEIKHLEIYEITIY